MNNRSKEIRRKALELSIANGGYHFGGSFSCSEILLALYDSVLTKDDIFILSKGHACWCYYALLQERGFSPRLEGHPHRDPHNGVAWTTGSLGHGLPAGIGMAMAKKLQDKPGKIFVLMGDGELQEGTTWESLLLASHHRLDNLTVVVDINGCQGSGRTDDILPIPNLSRIVIELGWTVVCTDGHNTARLEFALRQVKEGKPTIILASTVKGKGVSFMEDRPEWHARFPNKEEMQTMKGELA